MYSYPKEDESYGTYEEKKYEESIEDHEVTNFPFCGSELGDRITNPMPQNEYEVQQAEQQAQLEEMEALKEIQGDEFMPPGPSFEHEMCESCGRMVDRKSTRLNSSHH